jgi:ABC-type enterobactin transport system permease subunit
VKITIAAVVSAAVIAAVALVAPQLARYLRIRRM